MLHVTWLYGIFGYKEKTHNVWSCLQLEHLAQDYNGSALTLIESLSRCIEIKILICFKRIEWLLNQASHSGVLCRNGVMNLGSSITVGGGGGMYYAADTSSMEELQSAIQGAIAHCKNSMMQNKTMISNEI